MSKDVLEDNLPQLNFTETYHNLTTTDGRFQFVKRLYEGWRVVVIRNSDQQYYKDKDILLAAGIGTNKTYPTLKELKEKIQEAFAKAGQTINLTQTNSSNAYYIKQNNNFLIYKDKEENKWKIISVSDHDEEISQAEEIEFDKRSDALEFLRYFLKNKNLV